MLFPAASIPKAACIPRCPSRATPMRPSAKVARLLSRRCAIDLCSAPRSAPADACVRACVNGRYVRRLRAACVRRGPITRGSVVTAGTAPGAVWRNVVAAADWDTLSPRALLGSIAFDSVSRSLQHSGVRAVGGSAGSGWMRACESSGRVALVLRTLETWCRERLQPKWDRPRGLATRLRDSPPPPHHYAGSVSRYAIVIGSCCSR